MAGSLLPESLRSIPSFRDDFVDLLTLDLADLESAVLAVESSSELHEVPPSATETVAVLGFVGRQAALQEVDAEAALAEIESFAAELGLQEDFNTRKALIAEVFASRHLREERDQRDLFLATQYSGSRFQVVAVSPWPSGREAVAGLYWTAHVHGRDGDSQTISVVLSQIQAEALRRALDKGIEELQDVRRQGMMRISNLAD